MAGDVLRGAASCPLTNDFIKIRLLIGGELALRMGVEIGTLTAENKHQQQLGVQARRRHVTLNKELVRVIDGLFELHGGENVPQSARTKQKPSLTIEVSGCRRPLSPLHLQDFCRLAGLEEPT